MNTKTIATLIDAFHEAALEPEAWHDALTRLGEMVGGSGVVVVTAYDPLGGARLLKSIGYNPEYWDRVQAEHGTPKTNRYIDLMNAAPPGQVLQPRASMSLGEWLDDPIYRKFLRPDGLADGLAVPDPASRLQAPGAVTTTRGTFGSCRPPRRTSGTPSMSISASTPTPPRHAKGWLR